MSCGYACIRCGRCSGKVKPILEVKNCIRCGHELGPKDTKCPTCGMGVPRLPGISGSNRKPN